MRDARSSRLARTSSSRCRALARTTWASPHAEDDGDSSASSTLMPSRTATAALASRSSVSWGGSLRACIEDPVSTLTGHSAEDRAPWRTSRGDERSPPRSATSRALEKATCATSESNEMRLPDAPTHVCGLVAGPQDGRREGQGLVAPWLAGAMVPAAVSLGGRRPPRFASGHVVAGTLRE